MYNIEKNITRLLNGQPTYFLDFSELQKIKYKLRKEQYKIYYPYPDSEKIILYYNYPPEIILYEIKSTIPLRHQDILGTMFSLQITNEMFGDIIIDNNHYYIFIIKLFQNYFEANFTHIRNCSIELEILDNDYFSNYHRKYQELKLIVSSERIDTIICRVLNISRSQIFDKFKNKEIMYNQEILKDVSIKLKLNDTFSIRKIGKFKYNGVIKSTKNNNFIVSVYKYL